MADLDLFVKVLVQGKESLDQLGKDFDQTGTKAQGLSGKASLALGAIGGFAAGIATEFASKAIDAAIDAVGHSIDLASDKAEAAEKVNVLFGKSAAGVETASEGAADAVAMSSGKYLEAAGTLGNLLEGMGQSQSGAADMSEKMIQLAADMGSFNNADPSDVLAAIESGFTGATRPLRQYGVMLDEATVKQEAVTLGLYDGSGALDKSARAQAVYQLLLAQTTNAQGDLARTSDGLANQQKLSAARQEEAWTRLGDILYPIAQTIMPMVADALTAVISLVVEIAQDIVDWIHRNQALVDAIVNVAKIIGNVLAVAFNIAIKLIGAWIDWETFLANSVVKVWNLIAGVIGGVIGGVVGGIRTAINWFGNLWDTISSVAGKIMHVLGDLFAPLGKSLDSAIGVIRDAWDTFARFWNSIGISIPEVRIPNPLGGDVVIGGGSLSLPKLPVLDSGGVVTGPTLALLSANSRPEAVVPLDRLGGGGATVNVYAGVGDPVAIGRAVVDAVHSFERANGPAWAPVGR
jgi:hypothetical protein